MNKILLSLLLFAFAAYGQQKRIAIINTVDDEEPPIKSSELNYLTDRLRDIASKTLPLKSYAVMTQQSIVAFLGSQGGMAKACRESEGCLANLGRKIDADYIGQGRIGRFGKDLAIKVELYESRSGNLVSSFTGIAKDVYGLLSVLDEKAPDLFKRMPEMSVSAMVPNLLPIAAGLNVKNSYIVNISTQPEGAVLSFNGAPDLRCAKTPCKALLAEGNVRIVAALKQYESADTTVLVKQDNQSISIKLKPFGMLEIKPAYLDGIGEDEKWRLSINGKAASSLENKLPPSKYNVELNHKCYEALSFNVDIKDGHEVFDMASHIKLKRGGLVLNAEKDGEPVVEPVFVNGVQVGQTPFSGTVPICAEIELGENRKKVYVKLKHNENVTHTESPLSFKIEPLSMPDGKAVEIGYQRIWDMHHARFSYDFIYGTLGFNSSGEYSSVVEGELMAGIIYRWGFPPYDLVTVGFGLFGGLGLRGTSYDCEVYECDSESGREMLVNMRHELGIEFILGYFSLYIAERNFRQAGGGIGIIF